MNQSIIRIILFSLFGACLCFRSYGGEAVLRDSISFSYRQGGERLDASRGDNADLLVRLDHFLRRAINGDSIVLEQVHIKGCSSIEGTYQRNMDISRHRTDDFARYLEQTYQLSNHCLVSTTWIGEDWEELSRLVSASNLEGKDRVLSIIRNVGVFSGREKQLMDLYGGRPYREMARCFFPLLRRVEVTMVYSRPASVPAEDFGWVSPEEVVPEEHTYTPKTDYSTVSPVDTPAGKEALSLSAQPVTRESRPVFALKTNLLTGLLLTPSLEAEVFFTPHFSLSLEGHYAQWVFDGKSKEIYGWGFSPELRLYTSRDRNGLGGQHYFGAYYQQGEFDLRFSDTGRMGDYQGGGLSYGYALPLASKPSAHWWLEFGLGLGYSRLEYDRYGMYRDECKVFESHRARNYWGPTKLKLSIIYRFYASSKGGDQ